MLYKENLYIISLLVSIIFFPFYLNSLSAIAQSTTNSTADEVIPCRTSDSGTTSTTDVLDSCEVDLPKAKSLECIGRGSIGELFPEITQFETAGNVFFVDQNIKHRNIGIFERASVIKEGRQFDVEILIRYPDGITKREIDDLLVRRKIVTTNGAQVIFVVREVKNGVKTTYLYDGKDTDGNPITTTIWARVLKLGNIIYEGEKFITADGIVKILFSQPSKLVDSTGRLVDVFEKNPGTLVCKCKGCPIHSFDLRKLETAFDGDLVNSIIQEATSTESTPVEEEGL